VTGAPVDPGGSGYLSVSTRFGGVAREQTVRILAEMVANVIVVEVAVDDEVATGDTVCLMESMKMEIPVLAETGGVVAAVKVAPGDVVQEGDVLVELTVRR
jgi:acetyl-CoA carboxylase biotin carboxyl carrier protein